MKVLVRDIIQAFFIGVMIPGCLLCSVVAISNYSDNAIAELETTAAAENDITAYSEEKHIFLPMNLRRADGTVACMDTDEYLVGVVLGEMPASFEEEALKAQAVVARTYTQKAYFTGGKHGDGSVCTDPGCCQAYTTEEMYIERGGDAAGLEKVRHAVYETSGYVLTYEGYLIEATYFSCSGGMTEDAAAVWGTDYPYLRATVSPGEAKAEIYDEVKSYSFDQFGRMLGITVPGNGTRLVSSVSYTPGGGIEWISMGGRTWSGSEFRTKFGLKSTVFEIEAADNVVTVSTKGYGHRVGMSQYGADALAAEGYTFEQILAHYYSGTQLQRMEPAVRQSD